jgi:hypothetical protein
MLLKLFDNLPFDLRDKICGEVGIIKETEKNKIYFNSVLNELNYYINKNDDIKDHLIKIYEFFGVGQRINDNIISSLHDEIYYNDLDFILMCHKCVWVDIQDGDIQFLYIIKDIYKQSAKSYLNEEKNRLPNINNEIIFDDDHRFHYNQNQTRFELFDFCIYLVNTENRELNDHINNYFNNISDVELHCLLDICTEGQTAFMDDLP